MREKKPSSTAVAALLSSMIVVLALAFPSGGLAHPGHGDSETAVPLIEQLNPGGDDPSVVLPLGVLVGLLAAAGGLVALKGSHRGGSRQRWGVGEEPASTTPRSGATLQAPRLEPGS